MRKRRRIGGGGSTTRFGPIAAWATGRRRSSATNATPAAVPNKAFFEKVGMFKAKSKELTFPVDQKRGAGQGREIVSAPVNVRACAVFTQVSRYGRTSRDFELGVGMMGT